MDTIKIDDFQKIDIRIGVVLEAVEVAGSEKLIRQVVDFGPAPDGAGLNGRIVKIIFSGIKKWYKPSDLVGKHLPYVVNMAPRKMPSYAKDADGKPVQEESQGMLIAASPKDEEDNEFASLLEADKSVPAGTKVI
jgi:methionine--tRNA ligase beta chain